MTLTEFLLARIAEDEAVAQKAGGDEWEYAACCGAMQIQTVRVDGTLGYEQHRAITRDYEGLSDSVEEDAGPHVARHDPARVLTECEAKRRIVEEWRTFSKVNASHSTPLPQALTSAGIVVGLDRALRTLASAYADHSDYLPEWKP